MKWQFRREETFANGPAVFPTAPNGAARLGARRQTLMNGKLMNGSPIKSWPANGKPMNGKLAGATPSNGGRIDGEPANGKPTNGALSGNYFQAGDENRPELTPEQFKLRNMLLLAHAQQGVRSVLVTGTGEGVGVTSVAADLALGLSWDRRLEVLLIEANLRRPRLRELFRLTSESCGWILEDGAEYLDVVVTGMPNLVVIPAGNSAPELRFDAGRLAETMPALRELYDFIIIDAPPVKLHPELLVLSAHFDAAILVAEAERTRTAALQEAAAALHHAKANLLGVVLNREKSPLPAVIENWL
jgi:Mrp family chromosome partitioning ATPase